MGRGKSSSEVCTVHGLYGFLRTSLHPSESLLSFCFDKPTLGREQKTEKTKKTYYSIYVVPPVSYEPRLERRGC